jgi:hypothetical protein
MKKEYFSEKELLVIFIIFGVLIAVLIAFGLYLSFNDHEYTITVTDKDRIVESNDNEVNSKYIVWGKTPDGEALVFENTDNVFRLKFNSSNVQGELEIGETYKITVVGIRVPFLSWYENIIKLERIAK